MEPCRNNETGTMKDFAGEKCLPLGNPISEEFSRGDVLQSWIFLQRFHDVLGLKKCSSLEELSAELSGLMYDGLCEAHISILQILVDDLHIKSKHETKGVAGCSTECEGSTSDVPILNQLTWPELAKRYALLFMSSNGVGDSPGACAGIDVIRCLHGDGGPLCGALTGVAGLKVDTWLLVTATNKIYGYLNDDDDDDILVSEEIPDWVHVLEPVKKLKTNVGSKIKKCIEKSIEKCPPGWALKELEHSISKEVYKSNASGPTKKAALHVVARFLGMQQNIAFSNKRRSLIYTSDVVLKQCRVLLRRLAAEFGEMRKGKHSLGPSVYLLKRVHFRTIDVKLATGAYHGSHQAFAEDVRELCRNFALTTLYTEFEISYKNKIVTLHKELLECSDIESVSPGLRKDIEHVLPKATWDDDVCKICGIDENDGRVLLCDQCNTEYHTYCLSPPLARVPGGNWFCPCCVSDEGITQDAYQGDEKMGDFTNLLNEAADLTAMTSEKDYWDLAVHERTRLLRFFCDEVLNSAPLQKHINKCTYQKKQKHIKECTPENPPEFILGYKFLGFDCDGRLYWILDSGSGPWVVVNERIEPNLHGISSLDSKLGRSVNNSATMSGDNVCGSSCEETSSSLLFQQTYGDRTSATSSWICYQSEMEIEKIMDYLRDDKFMKGKLDRSILQQYKSRVQAPKDSDSQDLKELQPSVVKSDQDSFDLNNAMTKATKLLQENYGPFVEFETTDIAEKRRSKGKMVAGRKLSRCECLEPIFPTGIHCLWCHKTCDTKNELQSHGDGRCNAAVLQMSVKKTCNTLEGEGTSSATVTEFLKGKEKKTLNQDSSVSPSPVVGSYLESNEQMKVDIPESTEKEGNIFLSQEAEMELEISKLFKVPESSLRPIMGKSCAVFKQLKISLFDMEAALPEDSLVSSKAGSARKQAWHAFVKSATTIFEMVQAMIVFEDTIRADYLDEFWRRNFSSASAAASISTLAALSFRILSLDASICYQKIPCHSNKLKLQAKAGGKETKQLNLKRKKFNDRT